MKRLASGPTCALLTAAALVSNGCAEATYHTGGASVVGPSRAYHQVHDPTLYCDHGGACYRLAQQRWRGDQYQPPP